MPVLMQERPGNELAGGLRRAVVRAIETALERHELAAAEVSLTIVGDQEIRALNNEYRGIDRPTDVLSFPLYEPEEIPPLRSREAGAGKGPPLLLGDVVISLPRAREQADAFGHSLERELCFLAVHGVLHLLGYDHGEPGEERRMREETEAVLAAQGLARDGEREG